MIEYLPGLKKVFILTLSIGLTITILLIFHYNNDFFENKFVISLNGVEINARTYSEFRELFLVKNVSESRTKSYSFSKELFVKIPTSDKYVFNFNEYEIYNKFNQRESYSPISGYKRLKEVNDSKNMLKIERMGKVLYDGDFKLDISDIITGEGRYYFHIYNQSKRTSSPIARVNTMLTFNVLVVNDEG